MELPPQIIEKALEEIENALGAMLKGFALLQVPTTLNSNDLAVKYGA